MTDALDFVDQQAAAVQVAPRISKAYIESQITGAFYWNGGDMIGSEYAAPDFAAPKSNRHLPEALGHHTFCLLTARNGFNVVGHAAPASAENFVPELGRQFAYEEAFRKLWPMFAFALLQEKAGGGVSTDPLNLPS